MIALRLIGTPPRRFVMGAVVTLLALLGAVGVAGTANADVLTATDFAPSVWSDKADYSPGETVRLSGAKWQPGESVHVRVNDDAGSTWSRDVDVTADDLGAIADSFQLPDWFVAQYSVVATGASGATARTSFTDGNVKVAVLGLAGSSTAGITETLYAGAGCTGAIVPGTQQKPNPTTVQIPPTAAVGVGSSQSVRLDAPATAGGQAFLSWTKPSNSGLSFSFIAGTNNQSVCVVGFQSGNEDINANYSPNAAPVVTAPANQNANEGASTSFNLGSFSDATTDSPWSVDVDWGDGSAHTTFSATTTGSLGTRSHSYADGPATQSVSVSVTDKNGASATKSFTVAVANLAPTVTLASGNPTAVNEGGAQQTYAYTISDPGADTVSSVSTSCGTGGAKVAGSDTNTNTGGSFKCTFADGPAAPIVSATATDSDGAAGNLGTQAVTVSNVAPTVTLSGPATANEGDTKTYNFTVSDPGQDTWAADAGYPDCDAGASNNGTFVAGSLSLTASGGSFQCSFADGPSAANVKMSVRDSDGAADSSTQNVQIAAVANVNPTVTAPANQDANEGASASINLGSFSDPGPDSPWAVDVDWGDGSSHATFDQTLTGSLGSLNHTYADGPATRTVSVKVTDKNGGSDTKTFTVSVANVAPTVKLDAGNDQSVAEGATEHTYGYTISDAGQDTVSSVATSCGANGTKVPGSDANTDSYGSFKCTFPDGPASSTVSARATDSDGAQGTADNQTVSVTNVAPKVTLSAADDLSVGEGSTHTYSYTISDPGQDTVTSVETSCGATGTKASATNTDTAGSFACSFPDGPETSVVSASATDSDDEAGNLATQAVTVHNVAPTVTLSGANALAVDEGSTHTYGYTISDPGQDTVSSVATSCGANGTKVPGSDTNTDSSGSFKCTFPDGPASSTVSARATDSDNDQGAADSQTVSVTNVAPTVTLTGDLSVDEGSTHTYSFTVADPGHDDFAASAGFPDCDAGGATATLVADSYVPTASGGSFKCSFPDGPATANVKMKVADSDGASGTDSESVQVVTVANVAPTVTAAANQAADEGEAKSFDLGSFDDPGPDSPWSVDVDWGDGSTHTTFDASSTGGLGSRSHTYADGPATHTVTVRVTDRNGDSGTETFQATVANVAPTVTLSSSNDRSVDEGSIYTYAYTISDPGQDTVPSVDTSCGANGTKVSDRHTDASGSVTCSFPDGPASSTVSARATDSDGAQGAADTQSVAVANVAPTVTVSGANALAVDEGSTHTYTYAINDPGQDTVSAVDTSCGANGVKSNASNTDTSGSFDCRFPDGPSSSTVSASATDSDDATGATDTQAVAVANVAPTVQLSGAANVSEGSTHTYSFTVSDPGDDTFDASAGFPDCDAAATSNGTLVSGSYHATASGGSFDCSFPDGPSTANVKMKVADSDSASATDSESVQVVAVANEAPTLTAPATQSAREGTATSIDLGSFTDPGPDSPWAVDVDWGDGSAHTAFDDASTGSVGSQGHTYDDGPATKTVTVKVTDKNGASDTESFTVNVTNVAPKVTLSTANDRSVNEGTTHTYNYSISDPGQDTVQSVQPDCGGRGTVVPGSSANDSTAGSFKCSFADGLSPATATTVSVSAKDSDGDSGATDTQPVTVNNVAPTVTAAGDQAASEGSSQSFPLGSFGDPGADSAWKASVSWGDGSAMQGLPDQTSTGTLGSAAHTYADNGNYTVSVTVTDKDGGKDTKSFMVAVANVKPTITSFSGTDYLAGANAFVGGGGVASTLTTRFTDPGSDSWTGAFTYQDGSPLTETRSPFATGQQVNHTFASPGCKSAGVKVTDDDGGSDTASTTIKIGSGAFQPPMTNQPVTDKLKNGQVLPVKVHVNDCSGAAATTLTPAIRLVKGDLTPQSDDTATTITPPSVSAADTTGVMRSLGGGDYTYNMQVSLQTLNADYTVVVYPYGTGSPVELGHVIQATK